MLQLDRRIAIRRCQAGSGLPCSGRAKSLVPQRGGKAAAKQDRAGDEYQLTAFGRAPLRPDTGWRQSKLRHQIFSKAEGLANAIIRAEVIAAFGKPGFELLSEPGSIRATHAQTTRPRLPGWLPSAKDRRPSIAVQGTIKMLQGASHMIFYGIDTDVQANGDLIIGQFLDAVEQENDPGLRRKGSKRLVLDAWRRLDQTCGLFDTQDISKLGFTPYDG